MNTDHRNVGQIVHHRAVGLATSETSSKHLRGCDILRDRRIVGRMNLHVGCSILRSSCHAHKPPPVPHNSI